MADDLGNEAVVSDIDVAKGVVTLELLGGDDAYRIGIRELRNGLRDGTFDVLEAEEDEAEDQNDDDAGDDRDDEEAEEEGE